MATFMKAGLAVVTLAVLGVGAFIAWGAATFIDERESEGSAYGFTIGDTPEEVYRRAAELREAGDVSEIMRGQGSAAIPFDEQTLDEASRDGAWKIVYDPDYWNDSASLRFEGGRLVEIHRFRLCCELP